MTAAANPLVYCDIAIDVPLAVQLAIQGQASVAGFDFAWDTMHGAPPAVGAVVQVPWGKQNGVRLGVMLGLLPAPRIDVDKIKAITPWPAPETTTMATAAVQLPASVLQLARFAQKYYHRGIGEVLLPTVPLSVADLSRTRKLPARKAQPAPESAAIADYALTEAQAACVAHVASRAAQFSPQLIHGITGSGKTQIYIELAKQTVAAGKTVLVLVPEIILAAPMLARFVAQWAGLRVAVLHSGLTAAVRRDAWLAVAAGQVDVVIGTRLAVFAPLQNLGLVVVDEEHDASYKQTEGVRYSARDLALVLAQQAACPVLLGSATPSAESMAAAQAGRYQYHHLGSRAVAGAVLPNIQLMDLRLQARGADKAPLSPRLIEVIRAAQQRGEQSLVFINRRGYAPVLSCAACGWQSGCTHCSSTMAVHKLPQRWRLVCHHCASQQPVPQACPSCGNVDLWPEGTGTQQLESFLQTALPDLRIGRLDSDINRRAGAGAAVTQAMAAGELDVLVGTQMTAKGHDFSRLSTVIVLGADAGLSSPDFRGQERLFALLTQVAGRAGRAGLTGTVYVPTRQPQHQVYQCLLRNDSAAFYQYLLTQRRSFQLPPFAYHAAVRAQHKDLAVLLSQLAQVQAAVNETLQCGVNPTQRVHCYPPAPLLMAKVAGTYRAQVLLESQHRAALQACLAQLQPQLPRLLGKLSVQLEVDPIDV